jgi:branched-chain amino acid aminotransferase
MSMEKGKWIWHQGGYVLWDDARVHVSTHALHYGSSVFEGIRCYETADGPAIFRLRDHMARMLQSCKLMRMDPVPHSVDDLVQLSLDLVRRNGQPSCYLRPMIYRGEGPLGVNPMNSPIDLTIMSFAWGQYLGEGAVENGVDVCISSWRRIDSASMQPMGKIGGQYVNSQLASIEAKHGGFTEGILLDINGHVAEGAGQNVFLVIKGELWTPPEWSSILPGITRDTVLTLAGELGIPVRVDKVSREMLHIADEVFLTGTASEITPVRAIDRLVVGHGKPGPLTRQLQEQFFGIVHGRLEDRHGWLARV